MNGVIIECRDGPLDCEHIWFLMLGPLRKKKLANDSERRMCFRVPEDFLFGSHVASREGGEQSPSWVSSTVFTPTNSYPVEVTFQRITPITP